LPYQICLDDENSVLFILHLKSCLAKKMNVPPAGKTLMSQLK